MLLIIVIVLLVAVVFLIVRTASLGKRLQKLTQAFVNERHKTSQIVRYLNGDGEAFDGFGNEVGPQLRQPMANGQLGASGAGAGRRFQPGDNESRAGAQDRQLVQPERGVDPRGAQRRPSGARPQGPSPAQMDRMDPAGPSRMGGSPARAVGNAVRPIGPAGGGAAARQPQRNPYHEEREKRNKKGFGRRNKPVIPFGADRTNEQRAARAAAAMIDDAPALSMDLSEPAAILRQQEMSARRAPMGSMDPSPDRIGASAARNANAANGMNVADRANQAGPSNGSMRPRGSNAMVDAGNGGMQERRQFVGESGGMGRPNAMTPRPSGQQRMAPDGRMVDRSAQRRPMPEQRQQMPDDARRQAQGMRPMQEGARFAGQDRRPVQQQERPVRQVEEDPRVAQEKAAVSAAWIAEEERRMAERQARQAAQAKRAERREQTQLRRQAEAIVQEHHRQTQSARANDTMRFS